MSQLASSPAATTVSPAQVERPQREARKADAKGWWWGTGRRKTAVARVRLRPAKDKANFIVRSDHNEKIKTVEQYFSLERDRNDAVAPLRLTNTLERLEVQVRCHGGGYMGQAGAVKLGVARALLGYDPSLEPILREHGLLTRDARKVERKKYGQAGARRRFQFSKR